MSDPRLPVLVGAGQSVSHWDGSGGVQGAPSVLSLASEAAKRALADSGSGGVASEIDAIAFVRTFEDSIPGSLFPFGRNENLPGTLAREIGARPERLIYSDTGGQTPQALVSEMAAAIHDGEIDIALVAGGEAIGAAKAARRHGLTLDWADGADQGVEDRGLGDLLLSRREIKHGLVKPPYFYALFENAIAARKGHGRAARRAAMSALFARFSEVAAANPYAQFPQARSADWLATPGPENYEFADPFLKWHIAQDAVNQAAAVLLMAEETADRLGVPADKRVYLHGAGSAMDGYISERQRLDGSRAMAIATGRALQQAGLGAEAMAAFDLYSCFPCAVFSACDALGLDWVSETRPLTVTGGLPFFGGPGNNYSLHGIASMVERTRAVPGSHGLVLANGGWMTKEAAGVYSTRRPQGFTPAERQAEPDLPIPLDPDPATGTIETYTVIHGKTGPQAGIVFARTGAGARFVARADDALITLLRADASQVGRLVTAVTADEVTTASPA